MNHTLTVVLPVYNVSSWLEECLDSIFKQTRLADQIIAINDGSTDSSAEILEEYALKYPQLKIITQENGGLSVARNSGLKYATGDYVIFIDSDDFIDTQMFGLLLKAAVENQLDIALCNAWSYFEDREDNTLVIKENIDSKVVRGPDFLRQRLRNKKLVHMVWMHIYSLDFLKLNKFRFIPGQVHEDVIWTNQVLLAAKNVMYIPQALYYYRSRQVDTRSNADKIRRSREYVISCSIVNVNELIVMANSITDDSELSSLMRWQAVDGGFSVFHAIEKNPIKEDRIKKLQTLWIDGFYKIMWINSQNFTQRRKIIRYMLRYFLKVA
ncbi:MAG: glycosyltransferase [Candidatus Thioglobus sp.]|jgi:heptose III glucuronosyltransferase